MKLITMEKVKYFVSDKIIEITSRESGNDNVDFVVRESSKFSGIKTKSISNKSNRKRYILHVSIPDASRKEIRDKIKETVRDCLQQMEKFSCTSALLPVFGCMTNKISVQESFKIMMGEIISSWGQMKNLGNIIVILPENSFERCEKVATEMLQHLVRKIFRNTYPASDTIIKKDGGVVLIYRKNPPRGWAIPGGFINYGESAEDAAIREAKEETGLDITNLNLFGVFSDPQRDPRFHTLSIVFVADGRGKIHPGDDALKARVFYRDGLPEDVVFDHREILKRFFQSNVNLTKV